MFCEKGNDMKKLSAKTVHLLLKFSSNIEETSLEIGSQNIEKLNPNQFLDIIESSSDKDKTIITLLKYKKPCEQNTFDCLANANDKLLIAEHLKDNAKFTKKHIIKLLRYCPNKKVMASIIGHHNISELDEYYILNLLRCLNSENTKQIIEILGSDLLEKLDGDSVYDIISFAEEKDVVIQALGFQIINKLSSENIFKILKQSNQKNKIIHLLGSQNIDKLSDYQITNLLCSFYSPNEDLQLNHLAYAIVKYKSKLSSHNVRDLIHKSIDPALMIKSLKQNINDLESKDIAYLLTYNKNVKIIAKELGKDIIDKINQDDIFYMLQESKFKSEIASILGKENLNKLSAHSVRMLMNKANDQELMASLLGSDNINKLSNNNICTLFKKSKDKESIAVSLGSQKLNQLTGKEIFDIIITATDKKHIVEILGQDNINKLSPTKANQILMTVENKDEMKKLLNVQ